MSYLHEIKKRIFEEEKIEQLLELLGCWGIKSEQRGNLFTAGLPDGDNSRSVQVKNNEYLTAHIRTKGINGDIFDIVSYIKYSAATDEERKNTLHKSKYWICTTFNYYEYIDEFYLVTKEIEKEVVNYNNWLQRLVKQRNQIEKNFSNIPLSKEILNEYIMLPNKLWLDEGISYKTQKKFNVGLDIKSERIIFPVHNENGEIIAIKGRYIGGDIETLKNKKYLYLYPCNKSIELFNLYRATPYINEKEEVIVFEGAKSVMLADSMGIYNCVSIEGDKISPQQIKLLKNLGLNIKITFAYDSDKDSEFIKEQLKQIRGRMIYVIYDKDLLLGGKETKRSPVDLGKEMFLNLMNNYKYRFGG